MPEILYRDDINKFSVYRLRDIPDGVPRSGWNTIAGWRYPDDRTAAHRAASRQWLEVFDRRSSFLNHDTLCAVADEHAGPLLATESPRFTVGQRVVSADHGRGTVTSIVAINLGIIGVRLDGGAEPLGYHPSMWEPEQVSAPPDQTEDLHRDQTKHLGAQHGECQIPRTVRDASPTATARDAAAWSAHLRFLVKRSESERRAREPSVGWDPYGDD